VNITQRLRVLGALETSLTIGVLLGQGAFLLSVFGVATGIAG
jgi:hypothetical protein